MVEIEICIFCWIVQSGETFEIRGTWFLWFKLVEMASIEFKDVCGDWIVIFGFEFLQR